MTWWGRLMARGDARTPAAQRAETSDAASWDECVRLLMGPLMLGEPEEPRRRQALELAAAALRFAGEDVLAANLLDD